MPKNNEQMTYRSPILEERGGKMISVIMIVTIIFPFIPVLFLTSTNKWHFVLLSSLPLIFLVTSLLFRWFYVELDLEKIKIKSAVIPFWFTSYRLSEIRGVEFVYREATAEFVYLKIISNDVSSKRHLINLVSDENLPVLIEELERRKISVNTDKLQPLFERIEQRKREKAQGEALRRKAREHEEASRREREQRKK